MCKNTSQSFKQKRPNKLVGREVRAMLHKERNAYPSPHTPPTCPATSAGRIVRLIGETKSQNMLSLQGQ